MIQSPRISALTHRRKRNKVATPQKPQKPPQKEAPQRPRTVARAIGTFFITIAKSLFDLGVIALLAFLTVFLYAYYTTVAPEALTERAVTEASLIYDRTGEHELYRLYGEPPRMIGFTIISALIRWVFCAHSRKTLKWVVARRVVVRLHSSWCATRF